MVARMLRLVWAEIEMSSFRENLRTVVQLIAEGTRVMPVIKADAYGIGAVPSARVCRTIPQVAALAVATPEEAMELRESGIDSRVLVLGASTEDAVYAMVRHGVSMTVTSAEAVETAEKAAEAAGRKALVHLKVDVGMGRIGAIPGPGLDSALAAIRTSPHVFFEGMFTHFPMAGTGSEHEKSQMDAFEKALERAAETGLRPLFRHAANSAAILGYPRAHLDLVRPGIMIYGAYPDASLAGKAHLSPVLSLYSRVVHVKRVPAGAQVGYGGTYVASGETTIATIPIGYADGYPRLLSNRGSVLYKGMRLPIAGRVCMDQTMLDAGQAPGIAEGDLVTLIGPSGEHEITLDEVAELCQTIPHEILTGISARVPRIYV